MPVPTCQILAEDRLSTHRSCLTLRLILLLSGSIQIGWIVVFRFVPAEEVGDLGATELEGHFR